MNMREILNIFEDAEDDTPDRKKGEFGAHPEGPEGPSDNTTKPHKPQKSVTRPEGSTPPRALGEDAVDSANAVLASAKKSKGQATYNASVERINASNSPNKGEQLAKASERLKSTKDTADKAMSKAFNNQHKVKKP